MKELIEIIDSITVWGCSPIKNVNNKEKKLENALIFLWNKFAKTDDVFDKKEYPTLQRANYHKIREHVSMNFPQFGYYHIHLNPLGVSEKPSSALGDAIDDLSDIIIDLLEIKSRFHNNSETNALWFFKFIFKAHTKDHILNLLRYISDAEANK